MSPLLSPVEKEWNDLQSILLKMKEIRVPQLVLDSTKMIIQGFAQLTSILLSSNGAAVYIQSVCDTHAKSRLFCSSDRDN